jgi:hypothetical protein
MMLLPTVIWLICTIEAGIICLSWYGRYRDQPSKRWLRNAIIFAIFTVVDLGVTAFFLSQWLDSR